MDMNTKRTPLKDLGEFGLIEHLTKDAEIINKSTQKAVGDDAAVMNYGTKCVVASTDILLEGIHFDLTYTPLKHLGYKAAVVNFSDIYAMNAKPAQLLVSIGISARFCVEDIEQIYDGIKLACQTYKVDLVGGDTSSSLTGLTLSLTILGEADKEKICYRSGAKPNDLICLTGNIGAAYMGLQLLEREKKVFEGNTNIQPQFDGYDYVLQRFLKPEARKDIVELMADADIVPTSMIDISDGLSSEILHICKQSNVGARIYLSYIPIASQTFKIAEEMGIDAVTAALNGGEDYELLFTLPLALRDKIKDLGGIDVIGHITEPQEGAYLVTPEGTEIKLQAQGWQHV
ncbi:MAG: thiamine-phosphate kinase [Prevotellaceae bacterium]|jgi:thiamine-monophosphate kinase|nr:thiamine-phosphate kinase [Prevotellaceae bacterium]